MNPLQRVLSPIAIITSEKTAKDTKHEKKESQQTNDNIEVEESCDEPEKQVIAITTKIERRTGEDRRLKNITRGRWLDSREKRDRRFTLEIGIKA